MAALLSSPYSYFTDNNGLPLAGGKLFTYAAGTSTPQATYTDASGTVPAANPIRLDSAGKAPIWLQGNYRTLLTDSSGLPTAPGVPIGPNGGITDNVTANTSTGNMNSSVYDPANIQEQLVGLNATQILTNKTIIGATNIAKNYINRLYPFTYSGTSATAAAFTIASGVAADITGVAYIVLPTNTAWAVSNGNAINGYQGGTTLASSATIHFFVCKGSSGVGTFASTNFTPTLPTGYNTYYRRIFSLNTNASGVIQTVLARGLYGQALLLYLNTPVQDVADTTLGATAKLYTLPSIPTGIFIQPLIRCGENSTAPIIITSPDESDLAPSGQNAVPGFDLQNTSGAIGAQIIPFLTTNSLGQIRARSNAASQAFYVVTRGWIDGRGDDF